MYGSHSTCKNHNSRKETYALIDTEEDTASPINENENHSTTFIPTTIASHVSGFKMTEKFSRDCCYDTLKRRLPFTRWSTKYRRKNLISDLMSGTTVAVTVIPQALAYATIVGLPPQYGLYSSFMGCFAYMLLGSTRALTIGPTAVLCLLTRSSVLQYGPAAAVLLSFMSGCIELALGVLGFGFLVEFIAAPVVTGFSAAAALTVSTTQLKSLLGLRFDADGFISTWAALFQNFHKVRLWDSLMGIACIAALISLRAAEKSLAKTRRCRIRRGLWMFCVARNGVIILICSVIAALVVAHLSPEDEIPISLTGNITAGLPAFSIPAFTIDRGNVTYSFSEICSGLGSALIVIPLIAILETVAIAKSFGQQVDASQEMIALGVSNIFGSFVSSFPIAASFSRTAVNAASGVHSPLNGLFTGLMVILATSVLTPYFYFVPKSCLAAVIITALIYMVEVHVVFLVWRSRKVDVLPLVGTFFCCLFLSLELGILIGTCLSIVLLLYTTARPNIEVSRKMVGRMEYLLVVPDRSLVFTAMDYFSDFVRNVARQHSGSGRFDIVIDLTYVSSADYTTAQGFKLLAKEMNQKGCKVILTCARPHVLRVLLGAHSDHLILHEGMDINSILVTDGTTSNEESPLISSFD